MSGAVGEAMSYENATGGATDLDNLGQIMNQTNPPMDGKEQQSQARQEEESGWREAQQHQRCVLLSYLASHNSAMRVSVGKTS